MDGTTKQDPLWRRLLGIWVDAAVMLAPTGESDAWLAVRHTTLHGDLVAP